LRQRPAVPEDRGTDCSPQDLARQAEKARSRSRALRADSIKVTERIAETEETVAGTLARLAGQHPDDAPRLRAKAKAAEDYAAREWQRVHDRQAHQPPAGDS
jgi:hypothetical protein